MLNRRQLLAGGSTAAAVALFRRPTSGFANEQPPRNTQFPPYKNGVEVSVAQFKETVVGMSQENGGRVVVFDIGAPWCFPCVQIAVALDKLIPEFGGNEVIGWVRTNINAHEQYPEFEKEWNVDGIPHIGAYYNGKKIPGSEKEGVPEDSMAELEARLRTWLSGLLAETKKPHSRPPRKLNWRKTGLKTPTQ